MLVFAIVTVVFWLSYMFGIKILWTMLQNGGALSILLNLERVKDRLYATNKPFYRLLVNVLGDCEQCTSFWFAGVWAIIYYIFCKIRFSWISDGLLTGEGCCVTIIWLSIFWVMSAGIGHYFLTAKRNKNVV